MPTVRLSKRSSTGFKSLFLLGTLTLTACASDNQDDDDSETLASAECPSASIDGGLLDATKPASQDASANDAAVASDGRVTAPRVPDTLIVPSKNGTYFASIIANGTGCPAGTWNTSISPDGLRFTTHFSSFEVSVDEATPFSNKDCTLSLKLHSPQGLSYSLGELYYSGFMLLETGVQSVQSVQYWFQGKAQPPSTSNRMSATGPKDKEFVFKDEVETTDAVWSDCGKDRDLNIKLLLSLRNSTPRRSGYMSLAQISSGPGVDFLVRTRSCAPSGTSVVIPDAGIPKK